MREKRRANFIISHEMLIGVLGLPEGSIIVVVDADGADAITGRLSVLVEHKSLPVALELEYPRNIYPLRKESEDGRCEFGGWDR